MRARVNRNAPVSRDCAHCGASFTTCENYLVRGWGKYCSLSCSSAQRAGGRAWGPQDDALLRELFADQFNRDIAALMGRTYRSVARRAEVLGLKKSRTFYALNGLPFHLYPKEMQEVIRLSNRLQRKLDDHQQPE